MTPTVTVDATVENPYGVRGAITSPAMKLVISATPGRWVIVWISTPPKNHVPISAA